eukprot:943378-Prorocentrum_minimum.AAC.1
MLATAVWKSDDVKGPGGGGKSRDTNGALGATTAPGTGAARRAAGRLGTNDDPGALWCPLRTASGRCEVGAAPETGAALETRKES